MFLRSVLTILLLGITLETGGIPSPPMIVRQPDYTQDRFFTDGKLIPVYIHCEALGDPVLQYKWIKNGNHFDWEAYAGRITQMPGIGTLCIAEPHEEDIGQYQCFVENEYGVATSNSFFLRKAKQYPFKSAARRIMNGQEGYPFKLNCKPPDGWPAVRLYWGRESNGEYMKDIDNSRMTVDPEGNLWFSNLTCQDASEDILYVCVAASKINFLHTLGYRVILHVTAAEETLSQKKFQPVQQYVTRFNELAVRGHNQELFCIFGGTPLPQTVWKKNGTVIEPSAGIVQTNYGKSLLTQFVDFQDEGTYTCHVSNGVGEAKTHSINLKVESVPYFTVEPEIVIADEYETVEFRCDAFGVPTPQIKWTHNGKPIADAPPNPRRRVSSYNIVIEKLVKEDTGNYGCNATNYLGYVYKDVYVTVVTLAHYNQEVVDACGIKITCVFGKTKLIYKILYNDHLNIESDDIGEYTCYAKNKLDYESKILTPYYVTGCLNEKKYANVSYIKVSDKIISNLQTYSFYNLTHLRHVKLFRCAINLISNNSFTLLPKLLSIEISGNNFRIIRNGTFNRNKSLVLLVLTFNNIEIIESESFANLPSLTRIKLYDNSLSTIDQSWFTNSNMISYIDLSNNNIVSIETNSFLHTPNVKHILLANNRIATIEAGAFKGVLKLKCLELQNNQISRVNANIFVKHSTIFKADLSHNYLTFLPSQLFNIVKIQVLNIYGNPIKCNCLNLISDKLRNVGELVFAASDDCSNIIPVCITPLFQINTKCVEQHDFECMLSFKKYVSESINETMQNKCNNLNNQNF